MIKGCHKSVVFLKDTGSELFDEAYFVVKASVKNDGYRDIVYEAAQIASGLCEKKKKRGKMGIIIGFFTGALLGVGITLLFV